MAKVESKYFLFTLVILTMITFTNIYKEYLKNNLDKLTTFEKEVYKKIN